MSTCQKLKLVGVLSVKITMLDIVFKLLSSAHASESSLLTSVLILPSFSLWIFKRLELRGAKWLFSSA